MTGGLYCCTTILRKIALLFFFLLIAFFFFFSSLSSSYSVLFYDSAAQMRAFIDAALFHGLLYSSVIGKHAIYLYVFLCIILYYPSEQVEILFH